MRPKTRGDPTTRVTLSMTEGKSGRSATRRTEGTVLYVDGLGGGPGSNGNSNGVDGERGRVVFWSRWAHREPAGTSRGGSAGGGEASWLSGGVGVGAGGVVFGGGSSGEES